MKPRRLILIAIGIQIQWTASAYPHLTARVDLEEATLTSCEAVSDIPTTQRKILFDASDGNSMGIQDIGEVTRYMINVDVPFDSGSADGFVPYLSTGNSSINIRGVEGNRIQVTLDGIPQPPSFIANSFGQSSEGPGGTGRDFFDPAMYDRIDITKGSTLTQYAGGGLGGAVNLQTPNASDFLLEASSFLQQKLSYFDANESIASLTTGAARSGKFDALARYSYREGKELENNGSTPANPTDFDSHAVLAKVDYFATEQQRLQFAIEYYKRTTEVDVNSAETADNALYYSNLGVYTEDERERSRASVQYVFTPNSSPYFDEISSLIYYQETTSEAYNTQQGGFEIPTLDTVIVTRNREQTNKHDIDSLGLNIIATKHTYSERLEHSISYGLNLEKRNLENSFIRTDLPIAPTYTSTTQNILGFAPTDSYRAGLFIQDQITIGTDQRWFFTPSLRLDYLKVEPDTSGDYQSRLDEISDQLGTTIEPAKDYDDLSPSLSLLLAHQATNEWRLSTSYTYTNRAPTEEELSLLFTHGNANTFVIIPNSDLDPETSHAFEASADGIFTWGSFQATSFYTLYYDYIDPSVTIRNSSAGLDGISQPDNVGNVDIYGFELSSELYLSTFSPSLNGFTLGGTTGKSVGVNRTDSTWVNTIDPWKTVGWIAYNDPIEARYGTRFTATYVDEKTRINDEGNNSTLVPSDAYFLLDWSAYYEVNDHLTFYLGINNLLDREYYKWSTLRRSVGHGDTYSDRLTEPGRNFFISAVATF